MTFQIRPFQIFLPFLLCVWATSFFSYLGWKPGFAYNAQRYFEIFLLGCLLWSGAVLPIRYQMGRLWKLLCLLLAFIMCLVIWLADNHWIALREGMQYGVLLAAILVVAKTRQYAGSGDFDRAAYLGLVLFCFGCSLIVLEGLFLSLSINRVDQRIVFGAFVNIRTFAELQFLTLLMLPAAALHANSVGARRFIGLTAMLWWGLLLLSGTRSALVALPFALLLLGIVGGRQTLSWFKVLATHIAGGAAVFLILRGLIALILGSSFWGEEGMSFARASTSGRLDLWAEAWHHFLEQPWVGHGPGAFACLTTELVATPHNLFFQLLSEWGLFMTLLCLALALLLFISLVRSLRSDPNIGSLQLSLFATLVVTVVASMMEGMIIGPLQQMLVVLVFGWAIHACSKEKFVRIDAKELHRYQVMYVSVLAGFLTFVLWGAKSDLDLQRQLLVSPDGVINLSYGPRFWADGHDRCSDW